MPTLLARATEVKFARGQLVVELNDGRAVCVPLAWYPRLLHGSVAERKDWSLIGRGIGIHWPRLDEDISIEGILAGKRSGESTASIRRWMRTRTQGIKAKAKS